MQYGPGTGPSFSECADKAGLALDAMKDGMAKVKTGERFDADTKKKLGCASQCLSEKRAFWKDGALDTDDVVRRLEEFKLMDTVPNLKEGIKGCAAKSGADACDKAYEIMKCLRLLIFPNPPPK